MALPATQEGLVNRLSQNIFINNLTSEQRAGITRIMELEHKKRRGDRFPFCTETQRLTTDLTTDGRTDGQTELYTKDDAKGLDNSALC